MISNAGDPDKRKAERASRGRESLLMKKVDGWGARTLTIAATTPNGEIPVRQNRDRYLFAWRGDWLTDCYPAACD
jgi:hypothetical protein